MTRCVDFYKKVERDGPDWCEKCPDAVRRIEKYLELCRELEESGIEKEQTIVCLPEGVARPLFAIRDPEVKRKALEKTRERLNSKQGAGRGNTKKLKESDIKKIVNDAKKECEPVTLNGSDTREKPPKTVKKGFNRSNDNIEWARWSWNPVTGCLHGCDYCYARDIANYIYSSSTKFEPAFHEDRLSAPEITPYPDNADKEVGEKNVFVCSMADLFGEWVPNEWINAVLEKVEQNPKWNFLFLTKNPKKLLDFTFPKNAWVGTSVDTQARVKTAEEVFSQLEASVKFLSCEPLLEPVRFNKMSMFNWIIIGARSKNTRGPAFKPEWKWVESLLIQARADGLKVYFKPNLFRHAPEEYGPEYTKQNEFLPELMRPREYPGGV